MKWAVFSCLFSYGILELEKGRIEARYWALIEAE